MIKISAITEIIYYIEDIKAVIFDLDDTLYNEKEYVKCGYKAIAGILPWVDNVEKKLWEFFENRKSAIDELLLSEGIFTDELKWRCVHAYRSQIPDICLKSDVKDLLVGLKSKGYQLGIITDGRPEGQHTKIRALTLEEYVNFIIVTDELGGSEYRKPNVKAFEIMKKKMGVEYMQMCYVGDNIKKDFIAPEKLGIRAIWFQNKNGLYWED